MVTEIPTIIGEFEDSQLGDKRLDERLLLLASALDEDPEQSLPDILGDGAGLEACYRFFRNDRIDPEAILRPHVVATGRRLRAHGRVLAVHDTTELVFSGRAQRTGLSGDRFRAHFSLAVSADGRREPLGVLAIKPWVRGEKKEVRNTRDRRADEQRESKRWLEQSLAVEEVAPEDVTLIHVEDREGDIFESLFERTQREMHFIVRAQGTRSIDVDGERGNLLAHLRSQDVLFEREVRLSRRQVGSGHHNTYGDREGRAATLAVRAAEVFVCPPLAGSATSSALLVNAVHVVEVDPPAGGDVVEWLLVTTEPIGTTEEIEFVIDSYRARWVIEEYFKALKTGCAYEARQLESYDALLRLLSVFAVIAWRLLWMRFLAHHSPPAAASLVATADELAYLEADGKLEKNATVADFLRAVARLGGHLKHNGAPGWQVIWRGYRKLRDRVEGFALGRSKM